MLEDNSFKSFYEPPKSNLSGLILKIMKDDYKLDMDKIVFVIFTVINLTDDGKVNNPPNPPYININDLYYNLNISKNIEEIKKNITYLINQTKNYVFYKNNAQMEEIYKSNINSLNTDQIKTLAKDLLRIIGSNNPSTLIGSLESTDILQNVTYDKIICSYSNNKSLNKKLTNFTGFNLDKSEKDAITINSSFKNKYMKYKNKYLQLKNQN
jgi:hypothetical protein